MTRSPEHERIEKAAFEAFLASCPGFAAAVESWSQPDTQYPDIAVRLKTGRSIEFELGEWLHEAQMGAARRRETLEEQLAAVIGPAGENSTAHIRFVSLKPREPAPRFAENDGQDFKRELLTLIERIDARYAAQESWHSRHYYSHLDFGHYPILGKYLKTVLFDWRQVEGVPKESYDAPWIDTAPTGGSYKPTTALDALEKIVDGKVKKYGRLPDGSRLLVHYGRGWVYNTPFRGIEIKSFADVARRLSQALVGRTIPFEKIYLLDVLEEPGPAAFQIYPDLLPGPDIRD